MLIDLSKGGRIRAKTDRGGGAGQLPTTCFRWAPIWVTPFQNAHLLVSATVPIAPIYYPVILLILSAATSDEAMQYVSFVLNRVVIITPLSTLCLGLLCNLAKTLLTAWECDKFHCSTMKRSRWTQGLQGESKWTSSSWGWASGHKKARCSLSLSMSWLWRRIKYRILPSWCHVIWDETDVLYFNLRLRHLPTSSSLSSRSNRSR